MPYVLDSDVFIEARKHHYGMDFCPGFWNWLALANQLGVVYSIGEVQRELDRGNDELPAWAAERGPAFFLAPTGEVLAAQKKVAAWVANAGYTRSHIDHFLNGADSWLIAHGLACGYTVVTDEKAKRDGAKVKIPDVCKGLGVAYMTTFELLRRERARFVLGAP